jgi:hypothetical protein
MALADPQSVTINAVPISMPRTSSGDGSGKFTSSDGLTSQTVSHQYGKRSRRVFRVDVKKSVSDPYVPAQNTLATFAAYLVLDCPTFGYTVTEQKQVVDGLLASLSASSGAKITQILGGEA